MGDCFYRSKDPTNSIKVLKEKAVKKNNTTNTKKTEITHMHAQTTPCASQNLGPALIIVSRKVINYHNQYLFPKIIGNNNTDTKSQQYIINTLFHKYW